MLSGFGASADSPRPSPTNATAKLPPPNAVARSTYEVASWIWDKEVYDFQTCRFWKSFEIPNTAPVKKALLRLTADNGYLVSLDGREIGKAGEWWSLIEYDLTAVLKPGLHTLAVEAFNGDKEASVIVDLRIEFVNGQTIKIGSDASWWVVPLEKKNWEKKTQPEPDWRPATVITLNYKWGPRIIKGPVLQEVTTQFWQTGWFQILLLAICGVVILYCFRLMAQLTVQKKSQTLLQRERARLARDLHDDLGARITQLILSAEVTQRELPVGAVRADLDQLCNRMRDLAKAVHEAVWAVNSQRDTLQDFATYMCKYTGAFLNGTAIRPRFDISPDLPDAAFELPVRRNLFLAVKEALNNSVKHSDATEVFLRVSCEDKMVQVMLEDNGKGFDPRQTDPDRNGLAGMTQRLRDLGGQCDVSSEVGRGTRVHFQVPFIRTQRGFKWSKTQPAPNADHRVENFTR